MTGSISETKLLFIAGFPRSGTSWFASLFNALPQTIYRHEPLGRRYDKFGEELFSALKFNHGLSDAERRQAMSILLAADPDTDRPPFFRKEYDRYQSPTVHYVAWLMANYVSLLRPFYRWLFTPTDSPDQFLVIKEARSSKNLDSIVQGLLPHHTLFIFRHPYAVVASHLNGYRSGNMTLPDESRKRTWFKNNATSRFIQHAGVDEDQVMDLTPVELTTLRWCIYSDEILTLQAQLPNSTLVFYETLQIETQAVMAELLGKLGFIRTGDNQLSSFMNASQAGTSSRLRLKDGSNSFYSVYRGSEFDPLSWRSTLTDQDTACIDSLVKDVAMPLKLEYGL